MDAAALPQLRPGQARGKVCPQQYAQLRGPVPEGSGPLYLLHVDVLWRYREAGVGGQFAWFVDRVLDDYVLGDKLFTLHCCRLQRRSGSEKGEAVKTEPN